MKRYLCSNDFEAPHQLEAEISALAGERPAGSTLCFVRDRDTYSATRAVGTESQRQCVTPASPPRAVTVVDQVDSLGDGPNVSENVFGRANG